MTARPNAETSVSAAIRLNLGCGPNALDGFVNVDALDLPGVDVRADLGARLPFGDGSAEMIYASHLLEHFATDEVPGILREWRRVLADGGVLLVAVPDLEVIATCIVEYRGWFTPPHNPWLGAIYGGQKDEYDFHRTGFTLPWLAGLLTEAGFGSIERVDWFREIGASDLSRSELPFGRNVSLNVRAVAGGVALPSDALARGAGERVFDVLDLGLSLGLRVSVRGRDAFMRRRRRRLEDSIAGSRSSSRP